MKVEQKLEKYYQLHLLRKRITIVSRNDNRVNIDGKLCINFASNNYLGIANHPAVKQAFIDAIKKYGVGSGSSALVSGYFSPQELLEKKFAEFLNRDQAVFFSSAYMANLGVVTSLLDRKKVIISDKFCHSSLLDAIQLSRAKHYRYKHNDMTHLQFLLKSRESDLLTTEGIFSMEGDLAPLTSIVNLIRSPATVNIPFDNYNKIKRKKNDSNSKEIFSFHNNRQPWLIIDDSHALGVLGNKGGGSCEHWRLTQKEVPCIVASMGKAFGCAGAIVSGEKNLINAVLQFSRTYRNTTALPPAVCQAALKSLEIIQLESWRRERLNELIVFFIQQTRKRSLKLISDEITPIKGVLISDNKKTEFFQQELIKKGFFVSCIRPPTVPQGTARVRISLNCLHTEEQIIQLIDHLAYYV